MGACALVRFRMSHASLVGDALGVDLVKGPGSFRGHFLSLFSCDSPFYPTPPKKIKHDRLTLMFINIDVCVCVNHLFN